MGPIDESVIVSTDTYNQVSNKMKEVHAFDHTGPGGRNCPCCGPAPKHRKKHDRMVKRRIRQNTKKEIQKQILESSDKNVD